MGFNDVVNAAMINITGLQVDMTTVAIGVLGVIVIVLGLDLLRIVLKVDSEDSRNRDGDSKKRDGANCCSRSGDVKRKIE
ncbi:MAG: hypothetical protein HY754_04390 [Nitrospirae bacterium]|nr:hypothetical protein [Nitrospirota bacterium]